MTHYTLASLRLMQMCKQRIGPRSETFQIVLMNLDSGRVESIIAVNLDEFP